MEIAMNDIVREPCDEATVPRLGSATACYNMVK